MLQSILSQSRMTIMAKETKNNSSLDKMKPALWWL